MKSIKKKGIITDEGAGGCPERIPFEKFRKKKNIEIGLTAVQIKINLWTAADQ